MTTYTVRPGTAADADTVLQLRRHAERWLREAGIDQWTSSTKGSRAIYRQVADGTTFIVRDDSSAPVGSLCLEGPDTDFWTQQEVQQPASYLYKFMLAAAARGTGLGDALLNWACKRAASQGNRWLRLDCWRSNTALHDYYIRRGFQHVDTRTAPGRQSGALFERPTDVILPVRGEVELVDETAVRAG
ncbi:GNAT family N-acetyltransferase [Saccharomonospora piscinae]|uniref:GNAT family N-acetyltransferase n=1 Tax=Saccharomonospora piscinae TaxID=687388 RepID=UPI0011073B39|nr:GNAT family N-acetyltransferase [Saccharomonospora piscinae]TLW89244.1 GNAT family N-acetyltransferase [Saccharomonospora piscinae]